MDRQRTPKRSPSRKRSPVDPKSDKLAAREARKREQEAAREKRREERKAEREKERKEREAEREKDKEEKRIAKETVDTCQKLLVMTAPLAAKFEAALQHPRLKDVPKHIVAEAKAAHKQLGSIKAIAEKHINGSTQISDADKLIAEDKTTVPKAQESHKALTDFLETMDKHPKK